MQIVLAALLACLMLTTTAAQEEQQGVALNEPTARLFELGLTALEIAERTDSDAAAAISTTRPLRPSAPS